MIEYTLNILANTTWIDWLIISLSGLIGIILLEISGFNNKLNKAKSLCQKTQIILPIKIEKVVCYLVTKSLWREQQYRKYNFRYFSKGEYPLEEIHNKAKLGLITIQGSILNTTTVKEIKKEYWVHGILEYSGSYITTSCKDINRTFDFKRYNDLYILTPKIEKIWPCSSRLDEIYTFIFLKIKILIAKLYPSKKMKF